MHVCVCVFLQVLKQSLISQHHQQNISNVINNNVVHLACVAVKTNQNTF